MKCLFIWLIFSATCFEVLESSPTASDEVLEKLNEIRNIISEYKVYKEGETSLGHYLPLFRYSNSFIMLDVFNSTIDITKKAVAKMMISDASIRASLEAEKQNSCISSLLASLDYIIETSGYLISNCLKITNTDIFTIIDDYLKDVEASNLAADNLPAILTVVFIGRNIFTQPDEIKARIQELFDERTAGDADTLARLLEKSNKFAGAYHNEYFAVRSCLNDIEIYVQSSYASVQSRLPICQTFGERSPRY